MGFWNGSPATVQQVSTLSPQQMKTQGQLQNAAQSNGGVFNNATNYYNSLMSNESPDMAAFAAPEMRRFNEQIMPDLASQFAGMGAGDSGLTGSSFRNAAVGAGTDLSERLAYMRAQLRQRGAEGLTNIGQMSLNPYMQNFQNPAQPGFLAKGVPALLSAAGTAFAGPIGGAIGKGVGDWASSMFSPSTKASPEALESGPAGLYPKNGNYNPYTG